MILRFIEKTENKILNDINNALYKNSKGRFELKQSKKGILYMIDYDEIGKNRIMRNYDEIIDLLEIMSIDKSLIKKIIKDGKNG